jgi:hypothetical protein
VAEAIAAVKRYFEGEATDFFRLQARSRRAGLSLRREDRCMAIPAFADAHPSKQPDTEKRTLGWSLFADTGGHRVEERVTRRSTEQSGDRSKSA